MKLWLVIFVFSVAAAAPAGYEEGLQAYLAKDYSNAAAAWLNAARQGSPAAQNGLGFLYQRGLGLAKDPEAAVKWFRAAADQGYGPAEYNLGLSYHQGQGLPQSDSDAVKWFERAASHGVPMANLSLGNIAYNSGDSGKALLRWRLAAERGVAVAASNVGFLYAEGKAVRQNFAEAAKWYQLAASEGDPQAQYALGLLYRDGKGVRADRMEAAKWLRLAARAGVAEAVTEADSTEKTLRPAETTRVRALVAAWKAAPVRGNGDQRMLLPESRPSMHPGMHLVSDPGAQVVRAGKTASGIVLNEQGYVLTFLSARECSSWRVRTESGSTETRLAATDESRHLTALGPASLSAGGGLSLGREADSAEPRRVVGVGFQFQGAEALRNAVPGVMVKKNGSTPSVEFAETPPDQGAAVLDLNGSMVGLALPGGSRLDTPVIGSPSIADFLRSHQIPFSQGDGRGVESSRSAIVLVECRP